MASPIQNMIGIGAAGAAPSAYASGITKAAATANVQSSDVQRIIATQAVQVITQPGKQRITDDREVVDPSFDSEDKETKSEGSDEETTDSVEAKPKKKLDVMA